MVTPVYTGLFKDLFVSINLNSGHDQDMKEALEEALSGRMTYAIFQYMEKEPQHAFDATVRAIVLCRGALLDASPMAGQAGRLDPDVLIQFGISYAMGKEVLLVSVFRRNSDVFQSSVAEGYTNYYASFKELVTSLRIRPLEWKRQYKHLENRQTEYKPRNIMSFSVFGATPDVRTAIRAFVGSTGWRAVFHRQIDSISKLQVLAREIGERSFCIFCLDQGDEETFVGLGLAIGMGVPFILVHREGSQIPETLRGYHATIQYEQFVELRQLLTDNYAGVFLNPAITRWKDSTFRRLSSWGDDLVKGAETEDDLGHAEKVFEAIIASTSKRIPEPYAGLGDALLARYYKYESDNLNLLHDVRKQYKRALEIDSDFIRCKSGIEVIDRQIEILELLRDGKYKSVSSLIGMIGEDLTSEQYAQIRNFLLEIIRELIENEDYKNALAILLAMQRHDKSEEIENLIQKVLELAPSLLREAYFEAQEYISQLESEERSLVSELEQLEDQVHSLEKQLEKATQDHVQANTEVAHLRSVTSKLLQRESQLRRTNKALRRETERLKSEIERLDRRVDETESRNESLRIESNTLRSELSGVHSQLEIIKQINDELKRDKLHVEKTSIVSELESQSRLNRAALVNFGTGWGIYIALKGEPYVLREDKRIAPKRGQILRSGDAVVHFGGLKTWTITSERDDFPWNQSPWREPLE